MIRSATHGLPAALGFARVCVRTWLFPYSTGVVPLNDDLNKIPEVF
jgi:hypothetical protein